MVNDKNRRHHLFCVLVPCERAYGHSDVLLVGTPLGSSVCPWLTHRLTLLGDGEIRQTSRILLLTR